VRPGPSRLKVTLPPGALLIEASPGLAPAGRSLVAETTFDRDVVIVIRYRLPAGTSWMPNLEPYTLARHSLDEPRLMPLEDDR